MIERLYSIIIGLFIIGAILMFIINAVNPRVNKRNNWIKYGTYFVIVNLVLSCAAFYNEYFIFLASLIILIGFYEIINLMLKTKKKRIGIYSLLVFLILSYTLIELSLLENTWLLLCVFTVFIFDAFSQIFGQLFGKLRIVPKISPNKTAAGVFGGFIFAMISAYSFRNEVEIPALQAIFIGFGIAVFAFTGDLLASFSKRKFGVKDFSSTLPGHGGILDRFDSLVFTSLFFFILKLSSFL